MTDPLWIDASAGAPAYSSAELRRLMTGVWQYNGRTLGGKAGVRPGGNALQTSIAGSTITVRAGCALVDPALTTTQGPYWVALAADETHTLTAAHATLPRKDITVLRIYDHTEDSSGLRLSRSEYIVGTAAGSPSEPAVPSGAFKLSTIDVPNSGGGSPSVTLNYPFTVATGGVLPVRTSTERTALTPFDGMVIYRMDRDWTEIYDGSAWRVQTIAVCSSPTDRDNAITSPYDGQFAFTTDTNTLWLRASGAWAEFPNKPRANLLQTSAQSLTTNVFTAITFNAEDFDSHNGHDNVTNNSRYTAPRAGKYQLSGGVGFAVNSNGNRGCYWAKNGSAINGSQIMLPNSGAVLNTLIPARTIEVALAVSDYVELHAYQNSGGALNTTVAGSDDSHMSVVYTGS